MTALEERISDRLLWKDKFDHTQLIMSSKCEWFASWLGI